MTRDSHIQRATLTVAELAEVLGVGRTQVYEMVQTNSSPVPPIRVGRKILFSRWAVESFLGPPPASAAVQHDFQAVEEAKRYRETLEAIIDLCRRALNHDRLAY